MTRRYDLEKDWARIREDIIWENADKHFMKRPENGWGLSIDEASKAIDRLDTKIHEDFQNRIENGTTTIKKASTVHYHRLWQEVSKECGWLYSKKKTR